MDHLHYMDEDGSWHDTPKDVSYVLRVSLSNESTPTATPADEANDVTVVEVQTAAVSEVEPQMSAQAAAVVEAQRVAAERRGEPYVTIGDALDSRRAPPPAVGGAAGVAVLMAAASAVEQIGPPGVPMRRFDHFTSPQPGRLDCKACCPAPRPAPALFSPLCPEAAAYDDAPFSISRPDAGAAARWRRRALHKLAPRVCLPAPEPRCCRAAPCSLCTPLLTRALLGAACSSASARAIGSPAARRSR